MVSIIDLPPTDNNWVKNSFLLPRFTSEQSDIANMVFSSAKLKFTDTSVGGSFEINPLPQHTRYAALPLTNTLSENGKDPTRLGMSRRYSEMQDDNTEIIHIRCGVPTHTSMLRFYSGAYDYETDRLVKTGKGPSILYDLSKIAGWVVSAPIQPIIWTGKLVSFLTGASSTKFSYLKPTMPVYWQAVNYIVNNIAVNEGIPRPMTSPTNMVLSPGELEANTTERLKKIQDELISKEVGESSLLDSSKNDGYPYTSALFQEDASTPEETQVLRGFINNSNFINERYKKQDHLVNSLLDEIFTASVDVAGQTIGGGVDIYAIASKSHRLANTIREEYLNLVENMSDTVDHNSLSKEAIESVLRDGGKVAGNKLADAEGNTGLGAALHHWMNNAGQGEVAEGEESVKVESSEETKSWWGEYKDYFSSELRDGSAFLSLRVNNSGSVSESFSNSTTSPGIKDKMNSVSDAIRSKTYDMSGGNIDGGVATTLVNGLKDIAMGALDSVSLGGLGAIFGSAYMDIPDRYDNSTANLPSMTYTVDLRTLYDDPISRLISLWIPISCILGFTLPRSVGKHAYDSPFLCEVYNRGKAQSRYCIVESVSISRGEGDLAFSKTGKPLGIKVDITFKDLSSIMHVPITGDVSIFDEQNTFSDYMAILGGLGVPDQIYGTKRLKLNIARKLNSISQWTSPAQWAMWSANTTMGSILAAATKGTDRL